MTTFDDFYKALLKAVPDNKTWGTHFEKACKWFLQTDPRYVGRLEKVWLWEEWPKGDEIGSVVRDLFLFFDIKSEKNSYI